MIQIIQSGVKSYKIILVISIALSIITITSDISQIYGNLLSALSIIVGFFVNVIVLMHNFILTVVPNSATNYYNSIKETYERTAALIMLGSVGIFLIIITNIAQSPGSPLIFNIIDRSGIPNPASYVFKHFGDLVYLLPNFLIIAISYSFFLILVDIITRIVKMYHYQMRTRS